MSKQINLDEVRKHALNRIERSERNFKLAMFCAAGFEGLFLIVFLRAADFGNKLHILFLIGTVGSYTIIVLGLFVLATHITRNTQLVLKAIDLLAAEKE
jgi:hypothetical protein